MASFEELDHQMTALGELVLRRRRPLHAPDTWIHEVKLAGRFLMSSLVDGSERALAARAFSRLPERRLDVLVGGLGLGSTAAAVLAEPRVRRLDVVELLPAVVAWHRRGLVPLGASLCADARCQFVVDDCLALLQQPPAHRYDAVLLDIDDSPQDLLDPGHGGFYGEGGLASARRWLAPGGVLALWTNVPAVPAFTQRLAAVFATAASEDFAFDNPLLEEPETNGLYFASA